MPSSSTTSSISEAVADAAAHWTVSVWATVPASQVRVPFDAARVSERRSFFEARRPAREARVDSVAPPSIAQIAGVLLDAVMLDAIEIDIDHSERVNTSVEVGDGTSSRRCRRKPRARR